MIHEGTNEIDGVTIEVIRKQCKRINLRVNSQGNVYLTIPNFHATLNEGELFLKSKWAWILKAREKLLSSPSIQSEPITETEIKALINLLTELNNKWSARLDEPNVTWMIRDVKSMWGCCHWHKRYITYNVALARVPQELVEYVVVHEFTHFDAHNHGPQFYALMNERLPNWQILRKQLKGIRNFF